MRVQETSDLPLNSIVAIDDWPQEVERNSAAHKLQEAPMRCVLPSNIATQADSNVLARYVQAT